MAANVLIIAIGNESRGDDALGPLLMRSLQAEFEYPDFEFIEDFQLQVEHVTDLQGRDAVLFIDADVSCVEPFHFSAIKAAHDLSYTSHAMTPHALLHAYHQFYGGGAPPAFLLRIRGYGFELGESLCAGATANLEHAAGMIRSWLADFRALRE